MVDLHLNSKHNINQDWINPDETFALKLCNVGVQLGQKVVLQSINIELKRGSVSLLYGANGAGKSTLLKLLAGLHRQAKISGEGHVLNMPLWPRSGSARVLLGYMPQHGGLYEELSVLENLSFRAGMLGIKNPYQLAMFTAHNHALETVLHQRISRLSGGWKQRVAFAVALLANPKLVLLDEPTAGVDLEAKSQLWARVKNLAAAGATVLISSHDTEEARRADTLICLQDGKVSFQDAPNHLCLSLNLRIAKVAIKSKPEAALLALNNLLQQPAFLFYEIDIANTAWRIAWQGDANLADVLNIDSSSIQWLEPQLEDGLRAILRTSNKE